jgi:HNH endonuclease
MICGEEHFLELARRQSSRFWSKVKIGESRDSCWTWTAGVDKNGYGKFQITCKKNGRTWQKHVRAHVLSWELNNGIVGRGRVVMHSCDNPSCVRPSHLSSGTNAENRRDSLVKGRVPRGEASGASRISQQTAIDIIRLHRVGMRFCDISKKLGVSKSIARRVSLGFCWKHIRNEV